MLPDLLRDDRTFDAVVLPFIGVLQALLLAVGVFATREAFASLHSGGALPAWTLVKLIGTGLSVAVLEVFARISAERIGQSYANSLRIVLYRHIAGMRQSDLQKRLLGALSLRFVGDLSAARNWYGRGLPRMIAAVIILPGTGFVLWMLDPRIALASGSVLLGTMVLMGLAAMGFGVLHQRLRSRRASISIAMMERIAIAPHLDLMGRTGRELKALDAQGQQLREHATARAWRRGVLSSVPQVGLVLAGAVALWQAALLDIATGTVAATLSLLALLTLPLRDLAHVWDTYSAWRIARARVLALLAHTSAPRAPTNRSVPTRVRVNGAINGRAVAVHIPVGGFGTLHGGDMRDRSAVAMVMAGLDTVPGLDVDYGVGPQGLPRIGYVGETPVALQGSLRRALTLGVDPRPKRSAIVQMAKRFGLHERFAPLKSSTLKTRIYEGARNVTSSDSLRMDLTRVALSQPDLVVIDTARLSADPDRKQLIRQLRREVTASIVIVDRAGNSCDPLCFEPLLQANATEGQD